MLTHCLIKRFHRRFKNLPKFDISVTSAGKHVTIVQVKTLEHVTIYESKV